MNNQQNGIRHILTNRDLFQKGMVELLDFIVNKTKSQDELTPIVESELQSYLPGKDSLAGVLKNLRFANLIEYNRLFKDKTKYVRVKLTPQFRYELGL